MRPIRARKPLPQVGQKWVGAVPLELEALAFRIWRFCSADWVRLSSAVFAPEVTALRQEGRSAASVSQVSVLMEKSLRETLRLSLYRFLWPPTLRLP